MTRSDDALPGCDFPDLPAGEQFLLWALRQWVTAYKTDDDQLATIRRGFALMGIPDSHLALDELLTVVAVSATTCIDVRCQHCDGISVDEELFIGLIAALQRDNHAEGRELLSHWLAPTAVRVAHAPAVRLARQMANVGLALRPRVMKRAARQHLGADGRPLPDAHPALPTLH